MSRTATQRRSAMVQQQLAARGIRDDRVLQAMEAVPREQFVSPSMVEFAYRDSALPIEAEQTISQPYIVALMLEALRVQPDHRVLEVGAGSGYAAAVLSRLAAQVFAIERHRVLADSARDRVERLGLDNVAVRHGDGTLGWEEEAPFDAILVSAGGDRVPEALKEQLVPGGRLIMPVTVQGDEQDLVLHRKNPDGSLSEESLGAVRFVPLVGVVDPRPTESESQRIVTRKGAPPASVDDVRRHADVFQEVDQAETGPALGRMSGHDVLLLGESTHGTSEFYRMRARLTRELISRGEVDFVALEADWPDAAHLDRYVRGVDPGKAPVAPFTRFPRWMWANRETLEFLEWLREHNQEIDDPDERVGVFGLDLYSLHTSIGAILAYLDDVDPEAGSRARDRFACLTPWEQEPQTYGHLAATGQLEECEDQVVAILEDLLEKRVEYERNDGFRYMDAMENARLVANAERYHRAIYQGPTASWNLRDQHMFDTLLDLLAFHGEGGAAAVWAHNSHLGDASATELSAGGQHNLGQLCRRHFGTRCYAVGMGTHKGTVRAAHNWGDPGEEMEVRPSLPRSHEGLGHAAELPGFFLPLKETEELRRGMAKERLQRAIGVVYRPETERMSHYFHASLSRQFDEWIFVDESTAVTPLAVPSGMEEPEGSEVLDTFPFAV